VERMPGVVLRLSKLRFPPECGGAITAETYHASKEQIGPAAAALLPCTTDPSEPVVQAVGLSCTSMSFVLGTNEVARRLGPACPGAKTTDMASATVAALMALGISHVALLTPYIDDIASRNVAMLESCGLKVVNAINMRLEYDHETDKVTPDSILDWAVAADHEDAEAVLIGCSALRACGPGWIDNAERALGKPVVTSTQAFLWHLLRVAGVEDQIDGYGRLFKDY